ncbi:PilW family protein [Wukongibacter baidiensis]
MKFLRNNRGFTMVELVVVMAIMGIVFITISSFLINNIKTFNRAEDQVEAQHNIQIAMNEIVDNIMEARGIVEPIKTYSGGSVKEIIFEINESSYLQYDFDNGSKTLSRGKGVNKASITTSEYAKHIEEFDVTKILDDQNTVIGVEITITTELNDSDITLNRNQVYFRNAKP